MFDVAIVGGGAAGCVVVARLSESVSRSIMIAERVSEQVASLL